MRRRFRQNRMVLWGFVLIILFFLHIHVIFPEVHADADSITLPEKAAKTEMTDNLQETISANAVSVMVWQGNQIVEWNLEEYLVGVLAAEMPASFPEEALKAQAVAARSYILHRMANPPRDGVHDGAAICNQASHCKGYYPVTEEGMAEALWGAGAETWLLRLQAAVTATAGEILTYEAEPALAAFHAVSGGRTESAETVWGNAVPYLIEVDSPGEEEARRYRETLLFDRNALKTQLLSAYPEASLGDDPNDWLTDLVRSASGTIMSLRVGGVETDGAAIRSLLHLNSADFSWIVQDDLIEITTLGYGHGVGMSQYGARAMAAEGADYRDILLHYYPGCILETVKNAEILAKN